MSKQVITSTAKSQIENREIFEIVHAEGCDTTAQNIWKFLNKKSR